MGIGNIERVQVEWNGCCGRKAFEIMQGRMKMCVEMCFVVSYRSIGGTTVWGGCTVFENNKHLEEGACAS